MGISFKEPLVPTLNPRFGLHTRVVTPVSGLYKPRGAIISCYGHPCKHLWLSYCREAYIGLVAWARVTSKPKVGCILPSHQGSSPPQCQRPVIFIEHPIPARVKAPPLEIC